MTPKQKAELLIRSFQCFVDDTDWTNEFGFSAEVETKNAKKCALMVVDEILNSMAGGNPYDKITEGMEQTSDDAWYYDEFKSYWGYVKLEINLWKQ